jgi:ABC-type lipoprotein release transport system permease subunit
MAALAGSFGTLALVLACVGLYGLLAYTVTQRTSELGIRMALGAQRWEVLWLILEDALRVGCSMCSLGSASCVGGFAPGVVHAVRLECYRPRYDSRRNADTDPVRVVGGSHAGATSGECRPDRGIEA